jgi:hypothetical protein
LRAAVEAEADAAFRPRVAPAKTLLQKMANANDNQNMSKLDGWLINVD